MLTVIVSMLVIGLIATAIISLWNRAYNGRV
jgi:type II secretory pathway pseudopilin PulG